MMRELEQKCLTPPQGRPEWAYFLDVDGTLINHTLNIDDVQVTRHLHSLVQHLTRHCDGALALVSGRRLRDLQHLFPLGNITLIGQNGSEGCDRDGRAWRQASFVPEIQHRIHARLRSMLRIYPQLLLEDKGLMMTLHCRTMSMHYFRRALLPLLVRLVDQCNKESKQVQLGVGKSGVDFMPAHYGKGHALSWLMSQRPFSGRTPVFIGDDWADESAFWEVNQRDGYSIKVGTGHTCAHYQLQDVTQVLAWLSDVSH